jgi:molecular chaperone DnaK
MVSEAEQYGEQDKQRKELVEARNQADHVLYTTDQFVKDNADKLPASDKERVEKAVERLKKAREGESVEEIKRAIDEVASAPHEYSKKLYEEAAKQRASSSAPPPTNGGGPAPESKGPGGEKIIDAEFESK